MRVTSKIVLAVVLVALVIAVGLYSFVTLENSTIQLVASKPDSNSLADRGYYTFFGIADINVIGSCQPSTNISFATCELTVQVALSTNTSGVNSNVATKSITVELLGSRFSRMAVLSYPNANILNVQYTQDNSGDVSATVYTPVLYGGATWNFDFMIVNSPTNNSGPANLNLLISSQLVHTGIFGHDYNIEANVQFPVQNCTNAICVGF